MRIDDRRTEAAAPDDARPLRARVRAQLPLPDAGLKLIREHLGRAVPLLDADVEARTIVEEIVSHLGSRLGFTPRRDEREDVDVWASPGGTTLIVRAAGPADPGDQLRSLSQARDRLLVDRGLPARQVSALYVVCGSLVNWRLIEEAVSLRRQAQHVRLIALDALLSLVELRGQSALAHTDAVTLLRPQSARADAVVEIVTRGARWNRREPEAGLDSGREIAARTAAEAKPARYGPAARRTHAGSAPGGRTGA